MKRVWGVGVGVVLAMGGCDGKSATNGGGGGSYANTAQGLCEFFRDAGCAVAVTCGAAADLASCTSGFEMERCTARQVRTTGAAVQVTIDSALAASCLAQFDTCGELAPAECETIVVGQVAEGGACQQSMECQGDHACVYESGGCGGTCTKPAGEGQACYVPDKGYLGCAEGYVCNADDVCAKAAEAAEAGEACGATDCEYGLWCVDGQCADYAAAAAKCPTTETWEHCEVTSSWCSGGSCTLNIRLWVEAGKSCKPFEGAGTGTEVTRECQYGLGCGPEQTCVPPIAAGGACDPESFDSCLDGLSCDWTSKKCAAPPKLGEACVDNPNCQDSWCNEGKCAAYPGKGEDCSKSYDCIEGYNCDGATLLCVPRKAVGETCTSGWDCSSDRCFEGKCAEACK